MNIELVSGDHAVYMYVPIYCDNNHLFPATVRLYRSRSFLQRNERKSMRRARSSRVCMSVLQIVLKALYCTRYNYKSFQVPSQDKDRFDITFNVTVNKDLWLH